MSVIPLLGRQRQFMASWGKVSESLSQKQNTNKRDETVAQVVELKALRSISCTVKKLNK
jgi:hypothetical protein